MVTWVHDTGALLFFGTGVFYAILQAAISYQMRPYGSALCVCHTRTAFAVISLLAVLIGILQAPPPALLKGEPPLIYNISSDSEVRWKIMQKVNLDQ